jgi:hypothetical protein
MKQPDWKELATRAKAKRGPKFYGSTPREAKILKAMLAGRAAGCTLTQIADALNAQGAVSRSGKPWSIGVVGRILTREAERETKPAA